MGCLLKGGGGLHSRLVVGAVLLAAGEARRLGGIVKPLLELGGVPLIRRNLIALSGGGVDEVVVVLGHRGDEIEPVIRDFPITIVDNPDYAQGQPSSVRAGLARLSPKLDAIVVALADQPLINAEDVASLIRMYKWRSGASVVVPYVGGERANPIVFDAALRDEVLAGGANFGCRQWIGRNPERVLRVDSDNEHYRVDIDTPDDISAFEARYGHRLAVRADERARWPA